MENEKQRDNCLKEVQLHQVNASIFNLKAMFVFRGEVQLAFLGWAIRPSPQCLILGVSSERWGACSQLLGS